MRAWAAFVVVVVVVESSLIVYVERPYMQDPVFILPVNTVLQQAITGMQPSSVYDIRATPLLVFGQSITYTKYCHFIAYIKYLIVY